MNKILLIEPDRFLAESVADHINSHLCLKSEIADTMETAGHIFKQNQKDYLAVILNLSLTPDNYAPFTDTPTIAVTDGIPVSSRQIAFAGNVLDYVTDYSGYNLEYIIQLLKRSLFADSSKMLIVDDEPLSLNLMRNLLSNKGYSVLEARSAKEAESRLQQDPSIKLMIIDGDICEKNDFKLIRSIRENYKKNHLSIIPVCEKSKDYQRITLLRNGASDCIDKPFRIEDFHVRVMLNLQLVEVLGELTEQSNRDFLTRLYNRKYFFEIGKKLYENFKRGSLKITVAMMDIDYLKHINDTYGHIAGDRAIRHVAEKLSADLRDGDIIARLGGEEFAAICTNVDPGEEKPLFERLRISIHEEPLQIGKHTLNISISTGATSQIGTCFDDMLHKADMLMYRAKTKGRNCVATDE